MKDKLPKVLVVSINAWRENSGINTLMNLFRSWDPNSLAQIYTRSALPFTDVASRFFQISETKVLKSIIKRKTRSGIEVFSQPFGGTKSQDQLSEEARYKKGGHSILMSVARELVWLLGKWKTKELDSFVNDFSPDVLFFPIYSSVYMGLIQLHVYKKTNKPIVCYMSDDNYTYKSIAKTPINLIHRFFLRKVIKKIIANCSELFVITPKQKEECDRLFCVKSTVLTKGIDYSDLKYTKPTVSTPIRMVYTGKLIIGRWMSLASIVAAMGEINKNGEKIKLDIYTTDLLSENQMKLLNKNGCTVKEALDFEGVQKVQREADVLVFVECLKKKYSGVARMSFSTKLTDYFSSGKCIFAVGNRDVAPIDYLIKEDAAVVASSEDEIVFELTRIAEDVELIANYGKKAYDCGKRNHDKNVIDRLFRDKILQA